MIKILVLVILVGVGTAHAEAEEALVVTKLEADVGEASIDVTYELDPTAFATKKRDGAITLHVSVGRTHKTRKIVKPSGVLSVRGSGKISVWFTQGKHPLLLDHDGSQVSTVSLTGNETPSTEVVEACGKFFSNNASECIQARPGRAAAVEACDVALPYDTTNALACLAARANASAISACKTAFPYDTTNMIECVRARPRTGEIVVACKDALPYDAGSRLECIRGQPRAADAVAACKEAFPYDATSVVACVRARSKAAMVRACQEQFPYDGAAKLECISAK